MVIYADLMHKVGPPKTMASYVEAIDTWYLRFPSWGSDGNLYSPFTDGKVQDMGSCGMRVGFTGSFAQRKGGCW